MTPQERHRRRALGVAAAVAGAVGLMGAGGCGIQSSGLRVVGSAPSLQAANDVTGEQSAGGDQYQLYFFRDGKLTPVQRYSSQTLTQDLLLAALIKGPTAADQSQGFTSLLPASLSVISTTARDQQWDYEYSQPLTFAQKAEIVCSLQVDLSAPSVGTYFKGDQIWNNCSDFTEDYGAPAILPSVDSDSAAPSIDQN
ncbi:MAG TPA: hypothetical protein VH372_01425 [Actinospica sp.]|nr:hypothetical protein [Actinospica sp.]